MPTNDSYTVPAPVVEFLQDGPRSFHALRLTHGIIYALHVAVRGSLALVPAQFNKEHSLRAKLITDAVGPERANDNGWIHTAVREHEDQDIFEKIEIVGRRIRFRLSRRFRDSFGSKSRVFAPMQTRNVRQCRTLHDLLFLTLSSMNGGKNYPVFELPRIVKRLSSEPSGPLVLLPMRTTPDAWRLTWSESSRSWAKAAMRVSGILNYAFLIGPQQDMIDDRVTKVVVKVQHANTQWARGRLYKFDAGTRGVIEIRMTGQKSVLRQSELQSKWHQTVIE